ncbi:SRPBCC family protein [Pseudofulvibacter geojedonensis]|uniref:SRPBCC domain-containing protein n=1 Tax=Pseudofulvibacter geojedonensis TaxID=1123758 RepID=A0ABW3I4G2_9FLAO
MKDVIVQQEFLVSGHSLWDAITNHEKMIQWFFINIPDFIPENGFCTEFLIENEGRRFTHVWKIEEVVPNKKIVYNWTYKEYTGEGKVFFEIEETDEGSRLVLTNKWVGEFPQDIPEFSRESCLGGWQYFINGNLKEFLDKN